MDQINVFIVLGVALLGGLKPTNIGVDQLATASVKGPGVPFTNPKAVVNWGAVFAIGVRPVGGAETIVWVIALSFMVNVMIFASYNLLFSGPPLMGAPHVNVVG